MFRDQGAGRAEEEAEAPAVTRPGVEGFTRDSNMA